MLRKIIILAVAAAAMPLMLIAGEKDQNREIFRELRERLSEYKEANIEPFRLEMKNKFEAGLSSEELAELNKLRAEAAEKREDKMQEMRQKRDKSRNEMKEGRGRGEREMRGRKGRPEPDEEMKEIYRRAAKIVDRHSEVLLEIDRAKEEKNETWKQDMNRIIEEWYNEHKDDLSEKALERIKRMSTKRLEAGHDMMDREKRAVLFVLWDGETLK
ncbi:MAG: hypothetical protein ACLFQU_11995 [Candidatus Kapaibacterium sp.]